MGKSARSVPGADDLNPFVLTLYQVNNAIGAADDFAKVRLPESGTIRPISGKFAKLSARVINSKPRRAAASELWWAM